MRTVFCGLFALLWVPAGFWSQLPQWLRYGWPVSCLGQMFTGVYNFDVQVLDILSRSSAGSFTLFMLIGNVLMFIPLGLLLPLRWPKLGLAGTMAVGFAADILIELLQPIVGRAFDVDDIICNTLGIAGGALIYLLLRGLFPKTDTQMQRRYGKWKSLKYFSYSGAAPRSTTYPAPPPRLYSAT